MSDSHINSWIKAVKEQIYQNYEWTANDVLAVATTIWTVRRWKYLCSSGYVPADFQAKKVRIFIPGCVSVMGSQPSPHCCLSPGLQMAAKASGSLPICPISPQQTYFCFREWILSWQTSFCPRAAPRWAWRRSSKPSAKTSPSPPFGSGWTAAKSTSKSAVSRPT